MTKNTSKYGFTFLEVLMVMTIFGILVVMGVISSTKNQKKTDLTQGTNYLVDLIRRAQSEARSTKSFRGICFKTDGGTGIQTVQMYQPSLSGALPANNDCDGTDLGIIYSFQFGPGVNVCETCDANIGSNKSIFFNAKGNSSLQNGTESNFEICLIHNNMSSGSRTREIELYTLGEIKIVNESTPGILGGVVVNTGNCM